MDSEEKLEFPDLKAKAPEGIDDMKAGRFVDGETFMINLVREATERVEQSKRIRSDVA